MLPAVMFVVPWLMGHGRRRLAIAMAYIPPALVVGHYLFMGIAGRIGLLGIGTAVWFTVATITMIRLGPLAGARSDGSTVGDSSHLPAPHATWRSTATTPRLAPRSTH
jgi:hypothetical protein